jgi:nucleotide-binding universal stress UspA family protein
MTMKILLAVDGSKPSLDAVDCLVEHADWYSTPPEVELVTVHLPVPQLPGLGSVVGKAGVQKYYQEEGEERLAAARRKLDAAGIKYQDRVLVGQIAETLVKHAKDKRCDIIYVGTRGMSSAAAALIGSTATKVLQLATVPVLLVK